MGRLSHWLVDRRLDLSGLVTAEVERFVRDQRGGEPVRRRSPKGLTPLLRYLRGLGVIPQSAATAINAPLGRLLDEFVAYVYERGLASGTIWYYRRTAERFLSQCAAPQGLGEVAFEQVTAQAVQASRGGAASDRSRTW
jgi:hypothetical protein